MLIMQRRQAPTVTPPPGKQLWEIGKKENWSELEAILDQFDNLWVHDAISDHQSKEARRKFDEDRNLEFVVIWMTSVRGGDDEVLMKRFLALGVNPDVQNKRGWRATHQCSLNNRVHCAEALYVCRPDLGAKNCYGETPITCHQNGIILWEEVAKQGFPTIAQLSHEKKWWAVKNLCRRRVVPKSERCYPYKGKNAAEWAAYHGEPMMAQELRYLLNYDSNHHKQPKLSFKFERQLSEIVSQPTTLPRQQVSETNNKDELNSKLQLVIERQGQLQDQIDELKEAITLCAAKINDDSDRLRREIMENCAVAIREERENRQEEYEELEEKFKLVMKEDRKNMRAEIKGLKQALKAKDEVFEAQLKAVREEIAKMALYSGASNLTASPGLKKADEGKSEEANRPRQFPELVEEMMTLMNKYKR